MRKEIQIAAKLDDEDFNRRIGDMQRKLKDLYAPQNMVLAQMQTERRMSSMGLGGQPASQAQFRMQTQAARRELDQMIQAEVQAQQKLGKEIAAQFTRMKELREEQSKIVGNVEEEAKARAKMNVMQENHARVMAQYRQKDAQIQSMMEQRQAMAPTAYERLGDAYRQGGLFGAATEGRKIFGEMSPQRQAGVVGTGVALGGAAMLFGGSMYRHFSQMPIDTLANSGGAIQGTYGRELGGAYAGRSALEGAFLPEKAAAARLAMENNKRIRATQVTDIMGQQLVGIGGGLASGAAAGAGIGSLFGGVGAIPGAIVGAGLGAAGGAIAPALLPQNRNVALSELGSSTASDARNAELAKKFAEDFQSALDGEKQSNPLKNMAAEDYHANYLQNLQFQRGMGLDLDSFHGAGGYREQAIDAGFGDKMAMDASGNILGAGGSTRMARDGGVTALQAARSYNVTNASQILGNLSSGLGSSEASKKAFVEMIAEGQRIGLDSSQFAEENRKFLDATSQILSNSGSNNGNDLDAMTKRFGNFVADPTTKGIQAAQSAFQTYSDQGSQTSGPRGVLRYAAMRRDPLLSRLGGMDQAAMMAVGDDQMTSDHPVVQAMADKLGVEPEQVVSAMKGADDKGRNRLGATDKLQKSIQDDVASLANANPTEQLQIRARIKAKRNQMAVYKLMDTPELGKDQRKLNAVISGQTGGSLDDSIGTTGQNVLDAFGNKSTGKMEDETVQANAEGSRLVLDSFVKMKDQISATAEQIGDFNKKLEKTVEIASKLSPSERSSMLAPFANIFGGAQTQSQAGKPK